MSDKSKDAEFPEVVVPAPIKQEHGAQVRLTGEALAAARGGAAGTMEGNLRVKRALEASGDVADGFSPDGTSVTGRRQADDGLVTPETAQPGPGEERIKVDDPEAAAAAQAPAGVEGTTMTPAPDGSKPGAPARHAPAPARSGKR